MFMGAMPKIVKNVIADPRRRHPRGRRDPPQRPVRRRDALPRRRDRHPDLLRGRARRVLGRLGARARHRRRLPGPRHRPRRQLVGGEHLPGGQAPGQGRLAGGALEAHPRERPHAELQQRRHPGDDRRLRAREAPLRRAARPATARRPCSAVARGWLDYSEQHAPPGDREGAGRPLRDRVGWLDDDGVNRGVQAAGQDRRRDRGRRDHVRPDRVERRGADGLQLPVRGHDGLGDDVHHADDLPRRGGLSRLRAAERGDARAGARHRAEGLDLQPELPAGLLRPLLPGAARRRPRAASARAGDPEPDHGRQLRPPALPRLLRASTRRRASTGSTSRSTRAPTAAGPGATASTPSTA